VACSVNQYVVSNVCTNCAPGSTRPAGDDSTAADTTCTADICLVNQYVVSNVCTNCAPGYSRAAGDDATAADTTCTVNCANTDGTDGSQVVECYCGNSLCTLNQLCTLDNTIGTCADRTQCENLTGLTTTPKECLCGGLSSTACEKGELCTTLNGSPALQGSCSQPQFCDSTDGSTSATSVECKCGSVIRCTPGQLCNYTAETSIGVCTDAIQCFDTTGSAGTNRFCKCGTGTGSRLCDYGQLCLVTPAAMMGLNSETTKCEEVTSCEFTGGLRVTSKECNCGQNRRCYGGEICSLTGATGECTVMGQCANLTGTHITAMECICAIAGSSHTCQAGEYCVFDASSGNTSGTCTVPQLCADFTDTHTTNVPCKCGDAPTCNGGSTCKKPNDVINGTCTLYPPCEHTQGTRRNIDKCSCGTTICSMNQSCVFIENAEEETNAQGICRNAVLCVPPLSTRTVEALAECMCDHSKEDDEPIMCLTGQLCVPPHEVEKEEGETSISPGVCEDVPPTGVDPCPFFARSISVQCLCEPLNDDDADATDDDEGGKVEGQIMTEVCGMAEKCMHGVCALPLVPLPAACPDLVGGFPVAEEECLCVEQEEDVICTAGQLCVAAEKECKEIAPCAEETSLVTIVANDPVNRLVTRACLCAMAVCNKGQYCIKNHFYEFCNSEPEAEEEKFDWTVVYVAIICGVAGISLTSFVYFYQGTLLSFCKKRNRREGAALKILKKTKEEPKSPSSPSPQKKDENNDNRIHPKSDTNGKGLKETEISSEYSTDDCDNVANEVKTVPMSPKRHDATQGATGLSARNIPPNSL